jgi:hypothetical protein
MNSTATITVASTNIESGVTTATKTELPNPVIKGILMRVANPGTPYLFLERVTLRRSLDCEKSGT